MSRTPFVPEYSRENSQVRWFLGVATPTSDWWSPADACAGSPHVPFLSWEPQHFARVWPWPQSHLCPMAERCRLVATWAPHPAHLALMTLQEGTPIQTYGVPSSISSGPSAGDPPVRWRPLREHAGTRGAAYQGPHVSSKPRRSWFFVLLVCLFFKLLGTKHCAEVLE